MTSQHKSSTSPEVEFRINYLKQSMHVISTSRPSQTNSGPSSFSRSHSLCYSLIGMAFMAGVQQLFPSTCFSLNASPLPGTGSQTTGLLQRMESSPIAHRRPAETIDANLLMTLLWRLLKHQQRGRKHLLQGELLDCSQPGLNSRAISQEKKLLMQLCRPGGLFWGAITVMTISFVARGLICWLLLTPPHKDARSNAKCNKGCCDNWDGHHGTGMVTCGGSVASQPHSNLPHFWVPCQKKKKEKKRF